MATYNDGNIELNFDETIQDDIPLLYRQNAYIYEN